MLNLVGPIFPKAQYIPWAYGALGVIQPWRWALFGAFNRTKPPSFLGLIVLDLKTFNEYTFLGTQVHTLYIRVDKFNLRPQLRPIYYTSTNYICKQGWTWETKSESYFATLFGKVIRNCESFNKMCLKRGKFCAKKWWGPKKRFAST